MAEQASGGLKIEDEWVLKVLPDQPDARTIRMLHRATTNGISYADRRKEAPQDRRRVLRFFEKSVCGPHDAQV